MSPQSAAYSSMPCETVRPKAVRAAKAGSTSIGLESPLTSAKTSTSA